jgi:hypothetical protein
MYCRLFMFPGGGITGASKRETIEADMYPAFANASLSHSDRHRGRAKPRHQLPKPFNSAAKSSVSAA